MSYLADTSVFTWSHRREVNAALLTRDSVAHVSMTALEYGFSADTPERHDERIAQLARRGNRIDTTQDDLDTALALQRELSSGLRGRKVPDLIIAAVAINHGLTVLHYDADFELIAGFDARLKHEWIVPRGSLTQPPGRYTVSCRRIADVLRVSSDEAHKV